MFLCDKEDEGEREIEREGIIGWSLKTDLRVCILMSDLGEREDIVDHIQEEGLQWK